MRIFGAQGGVAVSPFPEGTVGMYEPAEELGEQVLEGLLVKGTRMTDTIPAGTIGNDRPIEIVTERWYSEDIDAMVLQRYSDPRFGETTYRLVNVVRGEPSPDLFQVPQGYEIKTAEMPRVGVRAMCPAGCGRGRALRAAAARVGPGAVTRHGCGLAARARFDRDELVDDEPLARRRPVGA